MCYLMLTVVLLAVNGCVRITLSFRCSVIVDFCLSLGFFLFFFHGFVRFSSTDEFWYTFCIAEYDTFFCRVMILKFMYLFRLFKIKIQLVNVTLTKQIEILTWNSFFENYLFLSCKWEVKLAIQIRFLREMPIPRQEYNSCFLPYSLVDNI